MGMHAWVLDTKAIPWVVTYMQRFSEALNTGCSLRMPLSLRVSSMNGLLQHALSTAAVSSVDCAQIAATDARTPIP